MEDNINIKGIFSTKKKTNEQKKAITLQLRM